MMYRLCSSRDPSITEKSLSSNIAGKLRVGVMEVESLEKPKKKFVLKIFHLQSNCYNKKQVYLQAPNDCNLFMSTCHVYSSL